MSLETASTINQLNPSNPSGADRLKEGDDHIRLIKATLKNTFPGITGALDPSITQAFLAGLANQLVPRGAITLFAGLVAPTGWWLCDGSMATLSDGSGTIVTPDLRGRAPVGADATHALGSLFGQYAKTVTSEAGGAATPVVTIATGGISDANVTGGTSLTVDQMPAHKHGNGIGDKDGGQSFGYGTTPISTNNQMNETADRGSVQGFTSTEGMGAAHTHPILANPGHTHVAAAAALPAHSHAVTIDTSQPSIAVNFIIKV